MQTPLYTMGIMFLHHVSSSIIQESMIHLLPKVENILKLQRVKVQSQTYSQNILIIFPRDLINISFSEIENLSIYFFWHLPSLNKYSLEKLIEEWKHFQVTYILTFSKRLSDWLNSRLYYIMSGTLVIYF